MQDGGPNVFASKGERNPLEQENQPTELNEQIKRLKMEVEWLKSSVAGFAPEEAG